MSREVLKNDNKRGIMHVGLDPPSVAYTDQMDRVLTPLRDTKATDASLPHPRIYSATTRRIGRDLEEVVLV
jgi:hypothetical protein